MENYWSEIRAKNEKKYQDKKDQERLLKIRQLPGWKVTMLIIFLDVVTACDKVTKLIERITRMK